MKYLFIAVLSFTSCVNITGSKKDFKNVQLIDYTFDDGWKEAYSLKINSDGVCIVGEGRWEMKYFEAQLSDENMETLDSLVQKIPFNKYESTYRENVVDQASYKYVVITANKDTITKLIYGKTVPKLLDTFSNKLRQIKDKLHLVKKDTLVDFKSRDSFYPSMIKSQ